MLLRPTTILIAQPDREARESMGAVLRDDGFDVEDCPLAMGLASFQRYQPDLVILVAGEDEDEALEICEGIRAMAGPSLPVLVLAESDDPVTAERVVRVGGTELATSPMPTVMLTQRIRALLRTRATAETLIRLEARLEAAQRIAGLGLWELAEGSEIVTLSAQAALILGLQGRDGEITVEEFFALLEGESQDFLREAVRRAREEGGSFHRDGGLALPDGARRAVQIQAETVLGLSGDRVLAGTIQDVTEREEAQSQIRRLAYYDSLTGLPNRALFKENLEGALARTRRRRGMLGVLFVDLDHFKRVNDTMGHSEGDRLLEVVARRLKDVVRAEDLMTRPDGEESEVARLGGDEFILLVADLRSPENAARVARRILDAFKAPVSLAGGEVFVSASVGISVFPQDGDDVEQLLKNADASLYHAKDTGRNTYQFYSPKLNATALERLTLERSLRVALERDEFILYYQPQVAALEGRVVGVEALLRWSHPELGLFTPAQFIDVAEETGLIQGIGEMVLRRACAQLDAWDAAGYPPVRMAVNISARQFRDPDFLETVQSILRQTRAAHERIELEVTESVLMDDISETVEILNVLESEGVRIAVDDFGSGYSSLSYLKRLPIHALKIDREFIRDIAHDPDNAAIVTAIVALARSMKLEVIAEGVEDAVQREYLHEQGCDLMQGYIFGKPMPAEEMEVLLGVQSGARRRKAG